MSTFAFCSTLALAASLWAVFPATAKPRLAAASDREPSGRAAGGRAQPGAGPRPPARSTAAIASLGRAGIARAFVRQAKRPLPRRLDFWSTAFLGTPYDVAPEDPSQPGNAPGAPLDLELRWVDCESFVEQVIALSLGRSIAEASRHLRQIRHDEGIPGPTRRHFTVVKGWLAKNEAAGYLKDLTRQIGGALTATLEKDLAPSPMWRPFYLQRYFSLGVRAPLGKARIDYLPLSALPTTGRGGLLGRLPHGAVLHLVSAPHDRSPYLVTHVGFVFQTPWGPIIRHASRSPHRRRVENRPLGPYLTYVGRTPAGPEMRTAVGIHLSEVIDPAARPVR